MDLIRRAAERLSQQSRGGIETLPPPPQPAGEQLPFQPIPVGPIPEPRPPRTSRTVKLDLRRIRSTGMLTPESGSSRLAEEFRVIKRPLLLRAFDEEGRQREGHSNLIMVTSARPGEGKTFVAQNLAMSLASERDINVLLIDADFARGSLMEGLGVSAEKGLVDVLVDKTLDLSDVMLRTDIPNLSLIPCGQMHELSTELLASQRMADLMNDIGRRYADRIVVIDTPPVLVRSEPEVLAMLVGQIVFVVEAESTPRHAVEEALNHVSGCPSISLLLNKRHDWLGQSQFGSYYGQYPGRE